MNSLTNTNACILPVNIGIPMKERQILIITLNFIFFPLETKKSKLQFLRLKTNLNNYEVCLSNVLVYPHNDK